ncbi:MAG: hypothetical protein L0H41_00765 [Microlunatus sp.]|nr:hypothetical protein [Microlunatus sp.]MDN5770775.1 hypothetical protein [Microlunatus sp.]MDN5803948.1 hypothetical protein [Microlunatus sp.]
MVRLVGSILMLAGVAAGAATYLWWLPCRGQMWIGTVFELATGGDYTDACLVTMDSGVGFPLLMQSEAPGAWMFDLSAASVLAAGLAWWVLVLALPWRVAGRCAGALFGAVLLAIGVLSMSPMATDGPIDLGMAALIAVDVTGVLALVFTYATWRHHVGLLLSLIVVLTAVTAFGLMRSAADYMVMGIWNSSNWDIPPGSGYLTAFGLAIGGLWVMVLWSARPPIDDPIT